MSRLTGLVDAVVADPVVAAALEQAREPAGTTLDLSAPGAIRPVLYAALAAAADRGGADRPVLAVTATFREAEELTEALRCLVDDPASVVYYPAWETLPHERLSPRSDTVGRRLAVLRRLVHPDPSDETTGPVRILVAPVRSVLQPQVKGLADLKPVQLHVGDTTELEDLIEGLAGAAYHRVDLVERRGEFAVRGGIIDVFPPTEEHPLRVDFFGDEVEEIRYFAVADQRSLELAEHGLWAPPCRELLLTDEVRRRAAALAKEHPELAELFEKLSQGHAVEGMESLAPVLVDEMELLVDLMPKGTHVVVSDPERVRARAHDLVATSQEFLEASWAAAAGGGQAPIDLGAAAYMTLADVRTHALGNELSWWSLSPFATAPADAPELRDSLGERVSIDIDADAGAVESRIVEARELEPYRGQTEPAMNDVRDWLRAGWRVVTITEGHGPAARLAEVFGEHELAARTVDAVDTVPEPGVVQIAQGTIEHGFVAPGIRLAVLTENDLVGQRTTADRRDASRMPSRRKKTIDPLELTPGDFVVHEQHGVGRYVEMMQRTVGSGQQGVTREYLVIEFAPSKRGQPGDRLYVPTDQLDQVTRYVGGEQPSLDRMGGSDWARRKGRARKAVRQIAAELIKLYAARQATKGHAFGPDTPWQRELEDAFPFVETPDQAATIDDVKRDMEKVTPMDRVVCGDVGYGKTEIAVRAAFKAVQDGKQVAVLVPTTLLVQQHYATFAERYAAFPVNVRPLSRFQTDSEAKATIEGLASGSVDVVIGTHRLLSGEIRFKDLGLVVVDEEQRFGVEHKEQLKKLRTAVDVLTMSATPIPRTLEMSITGIREMSTIATPPEERHPVLTFVGGYDEGQVTAAIRRELLREGQVFFVHNRVNTIEKAAARLRQLVPEARIAVAHGQMAEHSLEQVILDFWEKRADVIVCTTIVESGIDISNANTLIVERSDLLGLSQLHQLRGRVGRGRERAYAYFFFPPEKPLTETAHDRLATIAQHADLGAGMQVAMKDLEIRGAGNLLGGEQSGHIADVGFDLYVRLVGEAVAEYRGESAIEEPDVKIELPIDAHLPHDYVPSQRLRLEMYQRLAAVRTEDALSELAEELQDRYGDVPAPVANLVEVARFRNRARAAGLTDVTLQASMIRFGPVDLPDSRRLRLNRLYPKSVVKQQLRTILVPRPTTRPVAGQPLRDLELLQWCTALIDDVIAEPAVVV